MNNNRLLELAADLGYRLASNGAETFRVEESISRILTAYGITSEVFAIPNCLIVSIETPEGKPMTRMRRIPSINNNMDAIDRYNNLSRKICAETPDPDVIHKWMKEADRSTVHYRLPMSLLGSFLIASGFSIFFGGDLIDFFCSGLCGILLGFVNLLFSKLRVNTFFSTIIGAFISSTLAYYMASIGITDNIDAVIIGLLMILVPGLLFTNAMRDIIFGDTNSGVNRIVQVLLVAVAIALGTGTAWNLVSTFAAIPASISYIHPGWLQCLSALIACAGFALAFNVHGKGFVLCVLGGGIAWAFYCIALHFGCSEPVCYFVAALVSGLYSEIMARIRKYPATSYLVIALIPLFPGAGVYYATKFFVQGDMSSCAAKGSATIAIAGAIAIGVLIVSTIFRLYSNWRQRKA